MRSQRKLSATPPVPWLAPNASGRVPFAGRTIRSEELIAFNFGLTMARGMGQMPPPRRAESAKASSDWGFSIFGGGVATLVLRNITLDGNTFQDSPQR